MKIVLITGSPHLKGTSFYLADHFIKGAKEAGHEVYRFDAAFENVQGCNGCEYCRDHDGTCIFSDSMSKLTPELLDSEMIVFVSPLYYFGFSSQIKAVIDRFYAVSDRLHGNKKTMLLVSCADVDDWADDAIILNYRTILRYMGWTENGMLIAAGMVKRADIEESDFGEKAWRLGNSAA